jgi:hypothetical protein
MHFISMKSSWTRNKEKQEKLIHDNHSQLLTVFLCQPSARGVCSPVFEFHFSWEDSNWLEAQKKKEGESV